jgi:hypothetical protein
MHDPANTEAVTEARRLGGMRRKREIAVRGAYDVEQVNSVEGAQRMIEIALLDLLSLDPSLARCRGLLYGAMIVFKGLEVADFAQRLAALEAAKHQHDERSVFDPPDDLGDAFVVPGEQP